jgi:hypothetical protein
MMNEKSEKKKEEKIQAKKSKQKRACTRRYGGKNMETRRKMKMSNNAVNKWPSLPHKTWHWERGIYFTVSSDKQTTASLVRDSAVLGVTIKRGGWGGGGQGRKEQEEEAGEGGREEGGRGVGWRGAIADR